MTWCDVASPTLAAADYCRGPCARCRSYAVSGSRFGGVFVCPGLPEECFVDGLSGANDEGPGAPLHNVTHLSVTAHTVGSTTAVTTDAEADSSVSSTSAHAAAKTPHKTCVPPVEAYPGEAAKNASRP